MIKFYTSLFNLLGIKYTHKHLFNITQRVPYQNSLYGLGYVLNEYNIPYECIKVSNKSDLDVNDSPCIVILNGAFAIVTNISDKDVTYLSADRYIHISREVFDMLWNGVVMLLYPNEFSIEKDYANHFQIKKTDNLKFVGILVSVLLLFVASLLTEHITWRFVFLLLINITGIHCAYLLLQKQLHIPNRIADKLCGVTKNSHCENVTESAGATIFGLVKLSEVGFGFFLTNLIVLLAFPTSIFWLAIYAASVLPFSFWSIWYQKYKVKSWCVLCLSTLALMWIQAITYFIGGAYTLQNNNWITPIVIGVVYVLSVLLTNKLMTLLEQRHISQSWQRQYEELKSDEKVINVFEGDIPRLDTSMETCSMLIFGNHDAEKTLTVYSNPYCGPCALMHKRIRELVGNCLNVQYVMTYFSEGQSKINKYIIAAYQQLGADTTWEILTKWFSGGQKEGELFFSKYNLDITTPDVEAEFAKHKTWAQDKDLRGTPTDLLNGREIVWPYSVENYYYLPK